ncbi:hypothetical protein JK386_07060 [Nocardioides sp. zg-536]|uniref:Uncharacterized protein n=1 Tax=Nocardioides faecalis TaxID=2803858 RepID=A0A939BVK8_9ACTN|nr:hypothetical protein [Nocardioides faecalis]MBM9459657.1 hypothetical protein [Nocardioides faecalis]QVI58179.1 hypothetical protein KG111_14355 [Nocardioides faecalis]
MLRTTPARWAAVVVATLVVALAVLAAVGRGPLRSQETLPVGFVAAGSAGTGLDEVGAVRLPIGVVRLFAGPAVEEIAARRVGKAGEGRVRAQDGARIVPLTWRFAPGLAYDDLIAHPLRYSLAVVSDDERTELGEQDVDPRASAASGVPAEGAAVVVVDGDGRDLDLVVTYEDVAQTVDAASGDLDAGRAAALYPDGPTTLGVAEDCDARRTRQARNLDAGAGSIYCRVGPLTRTSYLPGRGWAPDGRVWSAVTLTVTAPAALTWLPTGDPYAVRHGAVDVTLSGAEPVSGPARGPGARDGRTRWSGTWVFSTPADLVPARLHVAAPMTAVRAAGSDAGPPTVVFGIDQTFTLKR